MSDETVKTDDEVVEPAVDEAPDPDQTPDPDLDVDSAPEPDPDTDPDLEPDDTPDDEPDPDTDPEPEPEPVPGPPGDPECEFDIAVGDVWTCPAGDGETVHVIGFVDGDPLVQSQDTSEQRVVSASTLILWRHDGPTHHEEGAARL
jgi:hypothetical protein